MSSHDRKYPPTARVVYPANDPAETTANPCLAARHFGAAN